MGTESITVSFSGGIHVCIQMGRMEHSLKVLKTLTHEVPVARWRKPMRVQRTRGLRSTRLFWVRACGEHM